MSYEMIDRVLRNNLYDDDYAEHSAALDALITQRTWVDLTNEEILLMSNYDLEHAAFIGQVQRKLKEKNT